MPIRTYPRDFRFFPSRSRIASKAATGHAPHSARARVRRRVRVVRSTANVAVSQATAPRARTALSVSRQSSVTRGQKHGAACHGRPAGDEPGPERARGRARVLRVASGGEGEGQTVLPRGTHARHATRDQSRARLPRDPMPTLGLLFAPVRRPVGFSFGFGFGFSVRFRSTALGVRSAGARDFFGPSARAPSPRFSDGARLRARALPVTNDRNEAFRLFFRR